MPHKMSLGEAVEKEEWGAVAIADTGDGDVVADGDAEGFVVGVERGDLGHVRAYQDTLYTISFRSWEYILVIEGPAMSHPQGGMK